jgi:hypothetical protein
LVNGHKEGKGMISGCVWRKLGKPGVNGAMVVGRQKVELAKAKASKIHVFCQMV